jgi:hypothetical protein
MDLADAEQLIRWWHNQPARLRIALADLHAPHDFSGPPKPPGRATPRIKGAWPRAHRQPPGRL